jgi:hypothetical protein
MGTNWAAKDFWQPWQYETINWFFLAGEIAPVLEWLLQKAYPEKEWIKSINMPIFIGAAHMAPCHNNQLH